MPTPAGLRLLQWLVIGLTASLIGGVITVIWLLVTRLPEAFPAPALPAAVPPGLTLPAGATAAAVTLAADWIGVATTDGRLFIFNRDGSLRQEIRIEPAP